MYGKTAFSREREWEREWEKEREGGRKRRRERVGGQAKALLVYNCKLNVSMAIWCGGQEGQTWRRVSQLNTQHSLIGAGGRWARGRKAVSAIKAWKESKSPGQPERTSGKSSSKSFTLTWTIDFFLWSPHECSGCSRSLSWLLLPHKDTWLGELSWAERRWSNLLQPVAASSIWAQLERGCVSGYWNVCSQVIVIVMAPVCCCCCCSKSTSSRAESSDCCLPAWQSLLYFLPLCHALLRGGLREKGKIENAHNLAVKDFNHESWKFTLLLRVYFFWFYNWF